MHTLPRTCCCLLTSIIAIVDQINKRQYTTPSTLSTRCSKSLVLSSNPTQESNQKDIEKCQANQSRHRDVRKAKRKSS